MNTPKWGRKETIIFPPHSPIYTYGAVFFALILTGMFVYLRFSRGQTPLQQFYTPIYARSAAGAAFNKRDKYQLLFVSDGARAAQLASEADVQAGTTTAPNGNTIPLALSSQAAAQGARILYRGPTQTYVDAPLNAYLRSAVFGGEQLRDIYQLPLLFGFLSLLAQLPFSIRKDILRRKELKYGRRLKGPVLLTPRQFNKTVSGDGIGFVTTEAKEMMRIPLHAESQHIELMGDTGAGKTTLIMQVLRQIQSRGHAAIVYDPACEFIQRFYNEKREDIVLNPLDERCPYWGPSEELRRKAEAKAIAASLYQPTSDKKGEFFTETPQKIFAHLLTYGPNPQQLVEWLSKPAEIDQRVQGTEMEAMIAKGAQQQRNGVLASLGLVADSLRMLPTKEQAKNKTWSATEWSVTRKGWIFITSSPTEREALRPLHSLWSLARYCPQFLRSACCCSRYSPSGLARLKLLYVQLYGPNPPVAAVPFLEDVLTSGRGWLLILLGGLVGLCFAALALCISVSSFPPTPRPRRRPRAGGRRFDAARPVRIPGQSRCGASSSRPRFYWARCRSSSASPSSCRCSATLHGAFTERRSSATPPMRFRSKAH